MPISNGSMSDFPNSKYPTVVWGEHKGAVGEAATTLQQMGFRIVERSRLNQVFDEQKVRLTYSSDDDAQILKVGKIIGAGSIVFVEVETSSSHRSGTFVNAYGGSSRSETVTNLSVSVRGVNVESGEVIWNGTAHYPQAITNPEAGVVYLTRAAMIRGMCPPGGWRDNSENCDYASALGTGVVGFVAEPKEMSEGRRLVVTDVTPNSPADKAGLKVGDVLQSCNGKSEIQTRLQYKMKCKVEPGQPLMLEVKRGNKITFVSATAISQRE